jgi:hypothetical protein
VALSQVEDILPPENRRSIEARHDMRPVPSTNMPPAAARRDWAVDEPAADFGEYQLDARTTILIGSQECTLSLGQRKLSRLIFGQEAAHERIVTMDSLHRPPWIGPPSSSQ